MRRAHQMRVVGVQWMRPQATAAASAAAAAAAAFEATHQTLIQSRKYDSNFVFYQCEGEQIWCARFDIFVPIDIDMHSDGIRSGELRCARARWL